MLTVHEDVLPGFIPERILDMMVAGFCEDELGICEGCDMACHCHVMRHRPDLSHGDRETFDLLCPILFHDAIRPDSWMVDELA